MSNGERFGERPSSAGRYELLPQTLHELNQFAIQQQASVAKEVADNLRDIREQARREPTEAEVSELVQRINLSRLRRIILEVARVMDLDIDDEELIELSQHPYTSFNTVVSFTTGYFKNRKILR